MSKLSQDQLDKLSEIAETFEEENTEQNSEEAVQQSPFCLIKDGKLPTNKIYEDSNFLGVLDIYPANPGQIILFSKNHIKKVQELGLLTEDFYKISNKLLISLLKLYPSANLLLNHGAGAGQRLEHLSVNIIPRIEGDKVNFYWQPTKVKDEDLKVLKEKISASIPEEKKKDEPEPVFDFNKLRHELERISKRSP